jgi:hypothetical protein
VLQRVYGKQQPARAELRLVTENSLEVNLLLAYRREGVTLMTSAPTCSLWGESKVSLKTKGERTHMKTAVPKKV